jgi:DNA-binding NarL/FixJ family response regulator
MTNVLLVDDNSKYLKDALPFYGYEVDVACDGVQALKVLEKKVFDIVLLDVMMPNMDGWQTLKAIRSNPDTKHLPVIMLTAVNEDQKMISGLKNGADDYITKPFILPNLLARIEAVLRRSTRQSEPPSVKNDLLLPLTAKEKEVLELVSQGFSNKEIADKMFVREVTIKTHLNSIFKKLKVTNRTQAVLLAKQI